MVIWNLTLLLDLKKPSHPPPKLFTSAVNVPVNWTKTSLSIFVLLLLLSSGLVCGMLLDNREIGRGVGLSMVLGYLTYMALLFS